MTFRGAKITRRRLTCGVAIVNSDAVTDEVEADRIASVLQNQVFHTPAVVLMAQHPQLGPLYYGRSDLVRCLERLDMSKIAWSEYTVK